jgi:hypothetical protein
VTPDIDQLYKRIIHLARSGTHQSAVEAYRLCKHLPIAGEACDTIVTTALIEGAVSLETHGAYAECAELLSTVADQASDISVQRAALFNLSRVLAVNGQFREACVPLERLLQLPGEEPSSLVTRLKLIHCRARAGEALPAAPDPVSSLTASEAAAWIEAAQSVEQAGGYDVAALMFDRLTDATMPLTLLGHALWHAVISRLARAPQQAELLVPKLLAYNGAEPPAAILWAKAIECLAHRPDVELAALAAIWNKLPGTITEDAAGVLMQAAFTLECSGHLDAARWAYEKLAQAEGVPDVILANVHLRLGVVLDAQGAWDLAVREYEAAAQLAGSPTVAHSDAAYRLARSREMAEEYREAAQMFGALRSDGLLEPWQRAEAQFRYALCLLRAGEKKLALLELEICRNSSVAAASLKADIALAELHESARDNARARECYERVLANPAAEPATKAAALTRLHRLKR